jgi:hypothetical protein
MMLWPRLPRPPDADLDRLSHQVVRYNTSRRQRSDTGAGYNVLHHTRPGGCVAASRWGLAGHTPRESVVRTSSCYL